MNARLLELAYIVRFMITIRHTHITEFEKKMRNNSTGTLSFKKKSFLYFLTYSHWPDASRCASHLCFFAKQYVLQASRPQYTSG